MKIWTIGVGALLLALGTNAFALQDDEKFRPDGPGGEKELTPQEAMRLLKEAEDLMGRSAELLQDSSRGKALQTDKEILKRIEKLLKEEGKNNASGRQGKVLKLIERLLKRSEKRQKDSIERLKEIIRKAKACSSGSCKSCQKRQQQQKKEKGQEQANRPKNPSNPATKPYNPNRTDPPSKFRSRGDRSGQWGDLPSRVRDAILEGYRDIDEYPPEYAEMIKEYMKRLREDK